MSQTLPTFAQLKTEYAEQYIPYQVRLGTQEWKTKRDAIVKRDKGKCKKCGCSPTTNIWHNGKMHYLLNVPRDPNELVEIGGQMYRAEEVGDETHQLYAAVILHVHHLYYIESKHPWEYADEALITLCNECHLQTHKTEEISVYEIISGERVKVSAQTCGRCHGAGYFPQYKKVENGVCFQCRGTRYTNLIL